MRFVVLISSLFFLQACIPQTPIGEKKRGAAAEQEEEFQEEEEVEVPTFVDASRLYIFSPVVTNLQGMDGSVSSFVKFDTSGETEYIEYEICPLEVSDANSICQDSLTPELGFILPGLSAGKVQITLTPCVSMDRAIGSVNCGQPHYLVYDSHRVSLEAAKLLQKLMIYEKQASALIEEHKAYLGMWLEQSKACAAQNTEVDELLGRSIMITEEFIKGPIEYLPRLILENDAVYERFTKPLEEWTAGLVEDIIQSCKEDDETEEDKSCQGAGAFAGMVAGIAEGMTNPIPAIGYLIQSVNNLTDPENSIPVACNQEEKLSTAHFQYESRKTILRENYSRAKTRLDELGVRYN